MIRISTKTALKLLGVVAAGLVSMSASAQSLPSAKATFAYGDLVRLPACSSTSGTCNVSNDSEWKTVLKQQIKTSNQKDLFFNASLQCGIVTDTTVKSMNATSWDSAEARGTVRVRIKIKDGNGNTSYAEPSTSIDANQASTGTNGGVVYCDRIQTLAAKFSGLNCTADAYTGAVTCSSPEELQLIQKTLNAAAFNFVAPNLVSGVTTIEVQARSSAATGTTGTNGSLANANAFIGMGSVAVESVRMIKGNDGTTLSLD
jgi:hypothetical protein